MFEVISNIPYGVANAMPLVAQMAQIEVAVS